MVTFNENLIGTLKIKQGENVFDVEIRDGNCLAVLIYDAGESYNLYSFYADKNHLSNIYKEEGRVIFDEVVECRLNYRYAKAVNELLYYFVRQGVEPVVYYE